MLAFSSLRSNFRVNLPSIILVPQTQGDKWQLRR